MSEETNPPRPNETTRDDRPRKLKKNARVVCAGDSVFWTTQKQFWAWVREGIVTYKSDGPLTGKFEGRREKLLVTINHVVLDESVPEHKAHVLNGYELQKPRRLRYPKRPVAAKRRRH
jgi:hypothetical protein